MVLLFISATIETEKGKAETKYFEALINSGLYFVIRGSGYKFVSKKKFFVVVLLFLLRIILFLNFKMQFQNRSSQVT